jgi:hypothetical protein
MFDNRISAVYKADLCSANVLKFKQKTLRAPPDGSTDFQSG